MAALLRRSGLAVYVGRFSIRIEDFEHFAFQEYGGDLGAPIFDADSQSLDSLLEDAQKVSDALKKEGYRHRMEFYDDENELVGYLHHEWPPAN